LFSSSSSNNLHESSAALDFGDPVESYGPQNGVDMVDSRGQKFQASREFKCDVDNFVRTYGRDAIDITVFEEDVVMLLDLGVNRVIGRDTMMAWGFKADKKIYARIKTSVYYRDGVFQKIQVQEGVSEGKDKFAPQFQLENIINNYVCATWAHDSKPFDNPLLQEVEDPTGITRSSSRKSKSKPKPTPPVTKKVVNPDPPPRYEPRRTKPEVSKGLRELVSMGFDIGKAIKALSMCDDDVTQAVAICCEYGDSLDTSDLDPDELNRKLTYIVSGRDDYEDSRPAMKEEVIDDKTSESVESEYHDNYLVGLIQYMQSRIPTLNEFCVICDKRHVLGHMLKPTVCTRDLCCWSFQELGVAAGATDFVATSFEVVDMLLMFAQYAIKSGRRETIFDPYPLIFDPTDRKRKIFDPDHKDYGKVERILTQIPTTKSIMMKGLKMSDELAKIDPYANALMNWVISSNRSFFVKLPPEIEISGLSGEQFLMLSSPPDKEKVFRSLRKKYGSVYAFHGSSSENWHSIVRHGLKNASGTALQVNGAAYGKGIYMSPFISTAGGYSRYGAGGVSIVAVLEVINHGINKATSDIWTVADANNVTTRMLLIFHGGDLYSNRTTGDSIAPQIRKVMLKYGVSQD